MYNQIFKQMKNYYLGLLVIFSALIITTISCSKQDVNEIVQNKSNSHEINKDIIIDDNIDEDNQAEGGGLRLGDNIYMEDHNGGDTLNIWNSYDEDEDYIYFNNPIYDTYYVKYNKNTKDFETDVPEGNLVKCWCNYCDHPTTWTWVICVSVDNCVDCCQKLCDQFPAPPSE